MAKDMYQKRKERKENKVNNTEISNSKTNINWYPGHMAKTKREIGEVINLIDVVVEVLDARIPIASRNPDIQDIIKNKKRVIILNKSDLADERESLKWKKYFEEKEGFSTIITDLSSGKGIPETIKQVEIVTKESQEEYSQKGRTGKAIRIMILGIPNVGKSSFINKVAKKNTLEVANRPGVTRKKQWIKVGSNIELLDTPGVLWPKFQTEEIALNLSYTGTIKDDIIEKTEVAFCLLQYLLNNYIKNVSERYKIDINVIEEYLKQEDIPENERVLHIMYAIGKKRGAIVSGGHVDEEKTSNIILEDFRSGKLGRISLEKVI
ncbi:MAG: ribosome biogenesis GTPase YlqF [Clostridia bacterium]|nr:ribosome biogenesis GTPase YlqF [Clostridia bacterium]